LKVINLWGGPCSGKSAVGAGLFYEMKVRDRNVELVTEFAKKLTWQKRHNTLKDQIYVTAQQNHRMEILREQVDFCITDSPLLLGLHYGPNYYPDTYPGFLLDVYHSYENINIFLNRPLEYDPRGRNQSEEEANDADRCIRKILAENKIPFVEFNSTPSVHEEIHEYLEQQNFFKA